MLLKNYFNGYLGTEALGNYSGHDSKTAVYLIRDINGNTIPKINNHGPEYGGGAGISNCSFYDITKHLKTSKSGLRSDTSSVSSATSLSTGWCFGNGNTPETIDDYNMVGDLFTTYTSSQTYETTYDDNGVTLTINFTLTNTGSEDFTIGEIGNYGYAYQKHKSSSYYYYYHVLWERSVLENPITIPAGGVGQIAYTVRMNYPVA